MDEDASANECLIAFRKEISIFNGVVFFSLALTFTSLIVNNCFRDRLVANAQVAARLYFGLSVIKVLLGILLFTVLAPTCPSGCYCGTYHPSYLYPTIVLLVGVAWALRGKRYHDMAAAQTENTAVPDSNNTRTGSTPPQTDVSEGPATAASDGREVV